MYTLTLALFDFLLTEPARQALEQLAQADLRDSQTLTRLTELRHRFSPEQAAALLDQARLRQRAATKFLHTELLYFTDEALQQASSLELAHYRAQYFAPYRRVADLGCGIGADTLALAAAGLEVIAIEYDPLRAAIARENVRASGFAERVRVVCDDWTTLRLDVDAAFIDPARRVEGRRVFGLEHMQPPLSRIMQLYQRIPQLLVKVAPGVEHAEIPPEAELEFISEHGILKEALLLFGDFRNNIARTATLLPGPDKLDSMASLGDVSVAEPKRYLYEPDPAIIRATLVQQLATHIGAAQLDATIAYLTSDTLVSSPFVRSWQTIRHGPFGLKQLNSWLRELHAGEVIIKKRGSPIDPDTFRRRLKTVAQGQKLTVFFTRMNDRPWMIIAEEL